MTCEILSIFYQIDQIGAVTMIPLIVQIISLTIVQAVAVQSLYVVRFVRRKSTSWIGISSGYS